MNPLRPVAIAIGRQPWLSRWLPAIVRVDQFLRRTTRGRFPLLRLAGLPELYLTVPGRRSGIPRTTPLLCVPHEDGWLVAGSNWGRPRPPWWVGNLLAADTGEVDHRGRRTTVSPRLVTGPERERLWARMVRTWPNFEEYAARTDREIPVFLLEPVGQGRRSGDAG